LLRQSYVGGFYTRRAAREGTSPDLYTLGADFVLATSTLFGSQNLSLEGFYLNTTNPLDTGDSRAYGARVNFPNDPWLLALNYSEVQKNYYAAVGYTPRVGFRRLAPQFTYSIRPRQHSHVRRLAFGSSLNWLVGPDSGETLNRDWNLTVLQTDFHSGDTIRFNVLPYYELLDDPFRIAPGVTLPAGNSYAYTRYSVRASTASRRVVAVTPTYEWGEFYSGNRRRVALDLNLRARHGLIFYLSSEWNQVNLAEGRFKTRLYRAIGEAQFTPRISVVNNVQYDTQSAQLGWQSRFRWIVTPGDDVYVVYAHNWLDDPLERRFRTLDNRLSSKVLYTHRF
jgi:hypothetical protein